MATDMASQWPETKAKLEQFKRDIHVAERQVALWRQFTTAAPVLFDALKAEAVRAEALAGKLEPLLTEFDGGKGSARDVAERIGEFATCWSRCQELYAAMMREAEMASKGNPLLGGNTGATAVPRPGGTDWLDTILSTMAEKGASASLTLLVGGLMISGHVGNARDFVQAVTTDIGKAFKEALGDGGVGEIFKDNAVKITAAADSSYYYMREATVVDPSGNKSSETWIRVRKAAVDGLFVGKVT